VSVSKEPTFAWAPITPRGVAAFARASFERLFVVQAIVALLVAAVVVWFLSDEIYPTVNAAISELPETAQIHGGRLDWRDDSPEMLGEGRILAFSVDLEHGGSLRSPADFQFEFGSDSIRIFSLFGETEISYPGGYVIAFNVTDAKPAWGAWAPDILGLAAIGTFLGLLLVWAVLATLYMLPVWLICLFGNRDLNLRASWKLAGAALMPGALLVTVSLALYGLGGFDIVQLCFAFGMHLVIGWIYLFVSPLFLDRALPAAKKNPFVNESGAGSKSEEQKPKAT
jgi:hypothetical protein